MNIKQGDRVLWVKTDMGWMMGPFFTIWLSH